MNDNGANGAKELVPVRDQPLTVRPYKLHAKSPAHSTAEWRRASACAVSFEEKIIVIRILYQLAAAGNIPAITLLMQYGMGKPGVGAAGKLADDVAADTIQERLALLPPERLKAALELLELLDGAANGQVVESEPPHEPPT